MKEYLLNNITRFNTKLKKEETLHCRELGDQCAYYIVKTLKKGSNVQTLYNIVVANIHPVVDERYDNDSNLANAIWSYVQVNGTKDIKKALTSYCKKYSGMKHLELEVHKIEKRYVFDLKGTTYVSRPETIYDINKKATYGEE